MVVIDIGCGPGYTAKWFPGSRYFGFDICHEYIAYANRKFGHYAAFQCTLFDEHQARALPKADLVLMMGLLHHLDDEQSVSLLQLAKSAMKDGGLLLTLDGCYKDGQSRVARYLLDSDRGEHIRTPEKYVQIAERVFREVVPSTREDLFLIPYTCIVLECTS